MTKAASDHYSMSQLVRSIRRALEANGLSPETVSIDDLASVDEFHIGGRQATESFVSQLDLSAEQLVLDIGCGLGGTSRYVASKYGVSATGIDVTKDFVDAGNVLSEWVGLDNKVNLRIGSALNLDSEDESFDAAYMLHVGMNIEDKLSLCREVNRVLRPGSLFGIYDIVRIDESEYTHPVPWASSAITDFASGPNVYLDALREAGFVIERRENRRDNALAFFEQLRKPAEQSKEPAALGLHLLMGSSAKVKFENMIAGVKSGAIAPMVFVGRKAS